MKSDKIKEKLAGYNSLDKYLKNQRDLKRNNRERIINVIIFLILLVVSFINEIEDDPYHIFSTIGIIGVGFICDAILTLSRPVPAQYYNPHKYNPDNFSVRNYDHIYYELPIQFFGTDIITNVTKFVNDTKCYDFEVNKSHHMIKFKYRKELL